MLLLSNIITYLRMSFAISADIDQFTLVTNLYTSCIRGIVAFYTILVFINVGIEYYLPREVFNMKGLKKLFLHKYAENDIGENIINLKNLTGIHFMNSRAVPKNLLKLHSLSSYYIIIISSLVNDKIITSSSKELHNFVEKYSTPSFI